MKKSLQRFFRVALDCAMTLLPYVTAWVVSRFRG